MAEQGGVWDYESLNHFVNNPKGWVPGTKMTFAGLSDQEDRADLLLYLRSLSDNPPPLQPRPSPRLSRPSRAEPAAETEGG